MVDIVTRLREAHHKALPDFYCNNLRFDACYEIERMRTVLSELENRFSAQEAEHYRIIRSLEAERDQWQRQAMSNG